MGDFSLSDALSFASVRRKALSTAALACLAFMSFQASTAMAQDFRTPAPVPGLEKINHIVVIYLENRSFDNLYGLFPGANGITKGMSILPQVDKDGKAYETLPQAINTNTKPPSPDARFPTNLPNAPFQSDIYAGLNQTVGDAVHRFYHQQLQINGGRMDKFVAWTNAGGLVMSYHDGAAMPLWDYAKKYVLMDNFFHAAFGGSFLNHFWLVCGCTPIFKDAPAEMVAKLDDKGLLEKDGAVTTDGFAVNTVYSKLGPYPKQATNADMRLPLQEMAHIGDRLSAKNISWAWYSGGWEDAVAGKANSDFQYHHQPFAYFKNMAVNTDGAKSHLKDEAELITDIVKGQLPAVTFFKPIGANNEHPGYTNVIAGERQTMELIKMIERSPLWPSTAVIVTYDENGGFWDHVAPPKIDRWGPGTRVPTLVISPYAKRGFIDHQQYDTTSILKLIETRFGLAPLGPRDAATGDMTTAFDFSQTAAK